MMIPMTGDVLMRESVDQIMVAPQEQARKNKLPRKSRMCETRGSFDGLPELMPDDFLEKKRSNVPIEQIDGDVLGDDGAVLLQCIRITATKLRRDFESHVKQLAKVGVVFRAARNMTQSVHILFAAP